MTDNGPPAVVGKRADEPPVDTDEIRALADAAGYAVVGEVTQSRPEDPGTHFGAGKVEELAALVDETDARTVIVDGELTPSQSHQVQESMPEGTRVFERYRLVLEIFGEQASTKRAQLQVELAQLQYDLPRITENSDVQHLNKMLEKGTPLDDVRDRIDRLERKLKELPDPTEQFREQRREEGFDLVTLAGYTNAGKSTLLHRLADDMTLDSEDSTLDSDDSAPNSDDSALDHTEKNATAAIEDRLFKTLETTTRRATLDGRAVLFTDTVGFIDDLPHWLVESFSETLSEAGAADAVVLIADASDPVEEFREKLRVSLDVLDAQGVPEEAVVTALNKIDLLDGDETARRMEVATALAPTPIPVSTVEGTNADRLVEAVLERLPTERATVEMPNCDGAMSVVSWAYDRTWVEAVDYEGATVQLSVSGRPEMVELARAKAESVQNHS
jgi:GTP-binding protein HflX